MSITDVVREAHQQLRKAVPALRRKAHAAEGQLAAAFREAMQYVDQQREAGVPRDERLKGLDAVLREAWPKGRVEPWKYLCERCGDTGWEPKQCTSATPCGRPFTLPGQASDDGTGRGRCAPNHDYVVPCWCEKGQGFRRGLMKQPRPVSGDDFTQAGRTKPTKVGR